MRIPNTLTLQMGYPTDHWLIWRLAEALGNSALPLGPDGSGTYTLFVGKDVTVDDIRQRLGMKGHGTK